MSQAVEQHMQRPRNREELSVFHEEHRNVDEAQGEFGGPGEGRARAGGGGTG